MVKARTKPTSRGRAPNQGKRNMFGKVMRVLFPHTMDKATRTARKAALTKAITAKTNGMPAATIDQLTLGLRSLLAADSSLPARTTSTLLTPDVSAGIVQGYAFEPSVRVVGEVSRPDKNHDLRRAAGMEAVITTGRVPIERFVAEASVRHHRANHTKVKREKKKSANAGKNDMAIEISLAPTVEEVKSTITTIANNFSGRAQKMRDTSSGVQHDVMPQQVVPTTPPAAPYEPMPNDVSLMQTLLASPCPTHGPALLAVGIPGLENDVPGVWPMNIQQILQTPPSPSPTTVSVASTAVATPTCQGTSPPLLDFSMSTNVEGACNDLGLLPEMEVTTDNSVFDINDEPLYFASHINIDKVYGLTSPQ